jgi:hypothetical protein
MDPKVLWEPDVPAHDRTLWNAKLFCVCFLDDQGALYTRQSDGTAVRTSRLTLTWLQDLASLNAPLPEQYGHAIAQWEVAQRLSLADILVQGDAMRMFHWRQWLQCAYRAGCGTQGRVLTVLGPQRAHAGMSDTFASVMEALDVASPALVLGLWLGRLCLHGVPAVVRTDLLHTIAAVRFQNTPASAQTVVQSFERCWTYIVDRSGDPSLPLAVLIFLKRLLHGVEDFQCAISGLLQCCATVPAPMRARLIFLTAWLFADNPGLLSGRALEESLSDLWSSGELSADRCLQNVLNALRGGHATSAGNIDDTDMSAAEVLEKHAQRLVAQDIQQSLAAHRSSQANAHMNFKPRRGMTVITAAPVRVDLAGGWSDTPPICYELSGSVSFSILH